MHHLPKDINQKKLLILIKKVGQKCWWELDRDLKRGITAAAAASFEMQMRIEFDKEDLFRIIWLFETIRRSLRFIKINRSSRNGV